MARGPRCGRALGGVSGADDAKRAAAAAAAALVEDGMRLGLGTGSTMVFAVEAIARRMREDGLSITGVPTSERTAEQASRLSIPLVALESAPELDLAIDGADEVCPPGLGLIKGLGGALLREKIVAQAAKRFVVVADESKLVGQLGERAPLPVEVVRFAHGATGRRLAALGLRPRLRCDGGAPYVTDNGNCIYDCEGVSGFDPALLERQIRAIAGAVETGLFLGMADQAIIAGRDGRVRVLGRGEPRDGRVQS